LLGAGIFRKQATPQSRGTGRERRETSTAARRQGLSRRDKERKRQSRALRSGRCPEWRGRGDLPAACFNQYNVAASPSRPDSFDSDSVAEVNARLRALQRTLDMRGAELEEAHRHIAELEEKLLKLKEYRHELKSLREERRRLRKSPERRVGQVFLAPYRL